MEVMVITNLEHLDEGGFNEGELIARCRMRDEEACRELFDRYWHQVFGMACRILRDESRAEDATQETFFSVFRNLDSFRGRSRLSTWIGRIAINVCLGMIRRQRGRRYVELEALPPGHEKLREPAERSPYHNISRQEMEARLARAFAKVGSKQRVVVRLHDLEGFTIEQIAKRIGCPSGTVKSRLFYGRRQLRQAYQTAALI